MVSRRGKILVAFVAVMAVLQILLEDALLFIGTTGATVPMFSDSPLLLVAIPLGFSILLFGVLLLSAFEPP